ncbi:hypothetical protein D1159_01360 [Pseudoflavonifractor sp. 524-17]|uniref:phage major tail tube protein n=1 Tax=Pseudoflavonifractor sp. 524-17 TaxID=2304577 RepID=UPI001D4E9904|nr:phage major tail tube protein [Pseudoflavonifractor sp. 524-17]NCE63258.1 hypothetical protein [Pseudoflavonifractor sp. 524-17]
MGQDPGVHLQAVVYYFAAYRNGEQLWEMDKRKMKYVIPGVDYMAEVRKALGK